MRRKVEHRRLEEIELVGNERIGRDERLLVRVGRIPLRTVGEVEEHLQVRGKTAVKRRNLGNRLRGLLQQTATDHLVGVRAGQRNLGLEPRLDAGEVVAMFVVHASDHVRKVHLRRDDQPGAVLAERIQRFAERLEIEHELRVVGHELADLIDEEVEPESRLLPLDVGLDEIGKVLDRKAEPRPVGVDHILLRCPRHLLVCLVDGLRHPLFAGRAIG